MRFKTGFVIGAAVGYVLGTRAGRERYDQMIATIERVQENERVKTLTEKTKAAADLTVQRVRGEVEDTLHAASEKVRDTVDSIAQSDDDTAEETIEGATGE